MSWRLEQARPQGCSPTQLTGHSRGCIAFGHEQEPFWSTRNGTPAILASPPPSTSKVTRSPCSAVADRDNSKRRAEKDCTRHHQISHCFTCRRTHMAAKCDRASDMLCDQNYCTLSTSNSKCRQATRPRRDSPTPNDALR